MSAVVEPVRGSTSGMGGPLAAIQQQDEKHDNLVGGPGPRRGSTRRNGVAGNAKDGPSSARGSGSNDDGRVRANTLGSRGTSRNVPFEGSQTVHQEAHMRSGRKGRGEYTSQGRGRGNGSYGSREQSNSMQHAPSPQRNNHFSPENEFQDPPLSGGWSSYQQEAGGRRDSRQLTTFGKPSQAPWGPGGPPPPPQQQGWARSSRLAGARHSSYSKSGHHREKGGHTGGE